MRLVRVIKHPENWLGQPLCVFTDCLQANMGTVIFESGFFSGAVLKPQINGKNRGD